MSATVDITEAFPASRRIPVEELTVQHRVFDTFGGTHALRRVHVGKEGVTIVREDGVPTWLPLGTEITAVAP